MKLNKKKEIRSVLVAVASGKISTFHPRFITYKELWSYMADTEFGQGCRVNIVDIITKISAVVIDLGLPPLNEIVVRKDNKLPGESWGSIRAYIKERSGTYPEFKSREEAQQACWEYWGAKASQPCTEEEVEEGVLQEKKLNFRQRNKKIVEARKKLDKYTCQVCSYRKKVKDKFIIDCHHRFPLGADDQPRITRISDLVCLCPNCHRISHTEKYPLSVENIKKLVSR